jgi:hypothetical protein
VASLWSAESSPVWFLELSLLDGQDAIVEALAACAGVTLNGQGEHPAAVLAGCGTSVAAGPRCCEHVREAAAAVPSGSSPTRLTVATSRTPLLVDGRSASGSIRPDRRRRRSFRRLLAGWRRPTAAAIASARRSTGCRSPSSWRPASPGR